MNASTVLGTTIEFVIIFALVFANGFFVAAEFALVKVRSSQLRPLSKNGGLRVRLAIRATEHLDAVLSATQFGITLASLALGWVGEPFLARRIAPVLAWCGVTDETAVSSFAFGLAFAIITFFHIVLGELAPKSLAIQRAKSISLWTAAPLMFFYWTLYPFIWALNNTANLLLRLVGLGTTNGQQHEGNAFSTDELEYVFSRASHLSPRDALVNRLMVQTLRVRNTTARQIMLPRDKVIALWLDKSLEENLQTARKSGRSRYPVCEGEMDNVRGLILAREWLWQMQTLGERCEFKTLIRPVLDFRLTTPVPVMIERFRSARSHLAVVLDDEHHLAGIVTFEDVLEEIVGDIRDELDLGRGYVFSRKPNSILVHGDMPVRELQAETGWAFEASPNETVGSWMLRHMDNNNPRRNDSVTIGEFRITADEVSGDNRLRRVDITRIEDGDAQEALAQQNPANAA
ncbi:MAG: hemolysin family protein [Puniceicoccales bacterium]|nr:hemolysin family protein [Puniceicoccales bacterium]